MLSVWVTIGVSSTTQREWVTYHPILAIDRLAHFHHNLMRIDSNDVSGSSYGTSACCYGVGVQG